MAKSKDKKKKEDHDDPSPADAVRSAVEQALAATFGGAASTRGRALDVVEEIGSATQRVRQAIDDLRVLEDLKGLRSELETLNRRVEALEAGQKSAPSRASAGTKPAGTRARGRSAAAARKGSSTPKARAGTTRKTPRSAASARKAPATKPPAESSSGRS